MKFYFVFIEPPSAPTNLRVTEKTNNRLTLVWNRPVYDGDRADLFYKVICSNCDHNVIYVPSHELNSTRFVEIIYMVYFSFVKNCQINSR